jgi:hypothetical protein
MSDVKLSFQCEGCGASLSFPSSEAGTVQDFPECGGWIDVPEVTRASASKDGPPWRNLQEELNARYFEECLRQQAENGRQIEVNREHQRVSDENIEREKSVLNFPGIRRKKSRFPAPLTAGFAAHQRPDPFDEGATRLRNACILGKTRRTEF